MKSSNFIPLIIIATLSLFSSCTNVGEDCISCSEVTTEAELTTAFNEIYSKSNIPGFAICIVKHGETVYENAFGKADIDADIPYTNQTIQPIGSISKTFIAAAIVKAIEQGFFTMETEINDLLPFTIINPKHPISKIRIKHLVTHTSGLIDNYEAYFKAYHILNSEKMTTPGAKLFVKEFGIEQRASISLHEFVASYYLPEGKYYSENNFSETPPGIEWNYSNIASSLAAFIIESATGISFSKYVQQNVLEPLQMNNTSYEYDSIATMLNAKLYWDSATPLPQYGNDSYPDGSVHTSIEDLSKYLVEMTKGASADSTKLFSNQYYQLLFKAKLEDGIVPNLLAENQGVFWFLKENKIKHDGSDPGTTCEIEFDADGTSGFALLSNIDASTNNHESNWYELSKNVRKIIQNYNESN